MDKNSKTKYSNDNTFFIEQASDEEIFLPFIRRQISHIFQKAQEVLNGESRKQDSEVQDHCRHRRKPIPFLLWSIGRGCVYDNNLVFVLDAFLVFISILLM